MTNTTGEVFTCELCEESFPKTGWSDEEAVVEMKEEFGDIPEKDRSVLCDDCYEKVMSFMVEEEDIDDPEDEL